MKIEEVLALAPVVPVLTIEEADHAVPLAQALVAGGLYALEVTLRTPAALESIRRIAREVKDAVPGVGTVTSREQRKAAADAGAKFAVSPGLIDGEGPEGPIPLLPGVATATELMWGLKHGFGHFKLFPANIVGGIDALKAFSGPFPDAKFCPTGGVDAKNAADYLALPNVACVGGSWVAPADAVRAGDWTRITELAKTASGLKAKAA
ncbi:bifunctional 4-hydroxy-2-oxoglutarate aldolase/2-dehydro-3-deoxy-phosphogluconate aldolase [Phenylobacterium sp.]|uniref:bifunctional 4-hydroxy-2-oxoglutarate aldolase/2-dehydro-3-deoxy-phosphogluconate aldolase n=1 Tax=Phenylobacterium sp. TaxID=1871053 RepID=UPI002E32715E|nr:bifunctional 4-hydroxy-2-oxoglutarate aldolase/2-dehydro-3-deoxy-phosphogluconate aldolase [Phenylobacterium sp.]HEX2561398.1 bifunctional 4-hydroxy-2-oxoglutarate aldolase/2-dehydro-3-deoxy-phosphogluconate aldolase [Phenylobacterium sp.]